MLYVWVVVMTVSRNLPADVRLKVLEATEAFHVAFLLCYLLVRMRK